MKRISFFSVLLLVTGISHAQDFFVQSGADVFLQNGAVVTLQGSLQNNGTLSGTGTFLFKGSSLQSITGTGTTNFHNLTIDNAAGVSLFRNIGVNNSLTFTTGNLDLKSFNVLLNPAATVSGESETKRITSTASGGYIQITVPIGAAATVNPGNLGITITPAVSMGSVTVRRGHDASTITPAGRPSINRYFEIQPATNAALNATATFNYFDAELNGRNESLLSFWTSPDASTWTAFNFSTRNTATNFVQLTAINSFPKRWTVTDQQFPTGIFELIAPNTALKLWPNPVANNQPFYVQLSSKKRIGGTLSIIDVSGKIVYLKTVSLERGLNTVEFNNHQLAKGVYTILVKAEDGSTNNINFIKQ
jgi:hypothetical protein